MRILLFHIVLLAFLSASAQQGENLMDWKTEYTVRTHMLQQVHPQYEMRREAFGMALQSKERIEDWQKMCRQKYIKLLGELPEKTPLNPQIFGEHRQSGYRVENVLFESRPGHHVTVNFYVPEGTGPFPAALLFSGHEMTSKATVSYQKTAILFALHGFAVLVVDALSQGEMVQFTDESGQRILRGSTTGHTVLNAGANLTGTSVLAYELYDNIRSLDYLLSRPEVDASRVGCLGNSGGGTQSTYLFGFDDRVKVAGICSFMASREQNLKLSGAADGCQQLPFEGQQQLEISDFVIMSAPKPVIILAGQYDFVDYGGTVSACNEIKSAYAALGAPDQAKLFTYTDGHGISKPKREAAVQWFQTWLCGDSSKVVEPELSVMEESELNCTPEGQLNSLFTGEKNIQDLNLERANLLSAKREQFQKGTSAEIRSKIKELLAFGDQARKVDAEIVGEEDHLHYTLKKLILRTPGEIPMPCLLYLPKEHKERTRIRIYLSEKGKNELAKNDSLVRTTVKAGNVLLLADLRGMGETQERADANEWKYYNREYHNAMIGLHIGKPLPGQRVIDVFTLTDYLAGDDWLSRLPITLVVDGAAGPVALYAALFRNQIDAIEQQYSIKTYYDILEYPTEKDWYSYVVPDVLTWFDLPDLLRIRNDLNVSYTGSKVKQKGK